MNKQLIITGDSHALALAHGASLLKRRGKRIPQNLSVKSFGNGLHLAEPFFRVEAKTIRFTVDAYAEVFESFGVGALRRNAEVVYGFTMAFHSAPLYRDKMWRDYATWPLAEELGLPPLSDQTIEAIAFSKWQYVRNFFLACRRLGIDFFVVSGPPPRRNHSCVAAGTSVKNVVAVDRLYREGVRSWLAEQDILFIDPPEYAIDTDGCLLEKYYPQNPKDHHHANKEYGEQFLEDILNYCEIHFG